MYMIAGFDEDGMLREHFGSYETKEEAEEDLLKVREGQSKYDELEWEIMAK